MQTFFYLLDMTLRLLVFLCILFPAFAKAIEVLDLYESTLYIDDKKELPKAAQYVSETTGKKIRTIGNKWSDFQIREYRANAQPYYVLVDPEGNKLGEPKAYDPDVESYLAWLQNGVEYYNQGYNTL